MVVIIITYSNYYSILLYRLLCVDYSSSSFVDSFCQKTHTGFISVVNFYSFVLLSFFLDFSMFPLLLASPILSSLRIILNMLLPPFFIPAFLLPFSLLPIIHQLLLFRSSFLLPRFLHVSIAPCFTHSFLASYHSEYASSSFLHSGLPPPFLLTSDHPSTFTLSFFFPSSSISPCFHCSLLHPFFP